MNTTTSTFEAKIDIIQYFEQLRRQTLNILRPLEPEDYVVQTAFFMSPPRWHMGHVSWFYDQLLRKHDREYRQFSKDFDHYLNSYYYSFGQPFDKGRRGMVSRPTVAETREYFEYINGNVTRFLQQAQEQNRLNDELRRLFFLAFQHEFQHQELLVYDIQHLLQDKYRPLEMKQLPAGKPVSGMVKIPGGIFEMGYDPQLWGNNFCYDVEMPVHKVWLDDFYIDRAPVSNGDYLQFIEDGGYKDFRHWLSDGWEWVQNENIIAPLYWEKDENGEWYRSDFRGQLAVKDTLNEPVVHISYYEAWAYARWAGKRLPTEAEWEKAAAWDEDIGNRRLYPWGNDAPDANKTNLLESGYWAVCPIGAFESGASYYGCRQMIGDTWEWTSSEFMSYPKFKAGFVEYNEKWFGNQKVLRGGSFGTPKDGTRNTYRNFFRPPERWLLSGFRCAKDV